MDPLGAEQDHHDQGYQDLPREEQEQGAEEQFQSEQDGESLDEQEGEEPAIEQCSSEDEGENEELPEEEVGEDPSGGDHVNEYQEHIEAQEGETTNVKTAGDMAPLSNDQVQALEKRLDQQEMEITDLKTVIAEMSQPEANQEQLETMLEKQDKMAKEVADLNTSIDALADSKSSDVFVQLKDRVDEQDNQIAGCQSLLDELSQSKSSDGLVEPLEKRIEQQENEINNLKTALAAAIQSQSNKGQVEVLEKRIEQQESEISNLNTCLADMQKRLKEVEATLAQINTKKATAHTNHIQATPKSASVSKSRTSLASRSKSAPIKEDAKESAARKSAATDQAGRAAAKKTKSKPTKKSGSSSAVSARQPAYNEEEGSVRIHLRGRPLITFKPSSMESYDITQPGQKPDSQLQLEWVYGYRGKDCRSNLYYLPNGEIVYFTAAVVVLFDPATSKQRHYTGHSDDVKCLALHPSKTKAATGQVAGVDLDGKPRHPQVQIWDVESLTTLHVLQSFDRSVAAVSFSVVNGGTHLCAIDESNDHVITVWNWAKEKKLAESKSSKDQVFGCEFNTHIDNAIVSFGKSHINFWTLEGSHLAKKPGLFEKVEKPKYLLCVAFTPNGEVLSGDSNGNILLWGKTTTKKILRVLENAHDGPVFSIFASQEFYLSAGKDGKIRKWNLKYAAIEQTEISEFAGAVRVVSCNDEGQLLVGTRANRILVGGMDGQFSTLVHGHVEELWGLAVHPTDTHFLTGAHDKHLILWDTATHMPLWSKTLEDPIQAAAFHPVHSTIVAVSMTTGRWAVVDSTSVEVLVTNVDGNEQHDVIRYSPDGKRLAIGSHDNYIYVYDVSEDGKKYTKIGQCTGHSSYITHFDWSSDGQFLQSNSGDYELLFWDAENCKQITSAPSMRDVEWDTQTCVLGFSVLGIWPEGADGTDINCAGRSNNKQLLVTGDDFGKVHLFNYPCSQPRSDNREYGGHSSHVTSVGFLADNDKLLTTGGQDCSILQWRIA